MQRLTTLLLLATIGLAGCGESSSPPPADGSGAEVPTPGGAVDLGEPSPPPGQVEPPPSGQPEAAPQAEPEADGAGAGDASAAADVPLQTTDWAGVEKLIASHDGKVVVVDLWSTSCIPCRREFPNLVKLHQDLGDKVACISVSTDYTGIPSKPVETYRDKVLEFLTQQQAAFENVLINTPAEDLFNALKVGSIPAVFVYDKSGKRVKVFADPIEGEEFTYTDHIRPLVESLVAAE